MCVIEEDFLQKNGSSLPLPWATQDTSSAGTPTLDYAADATNGAFQLGLATTTEAEAISLYWADQRMIDITKKPVMLFRAAVIPDATGAGGVFASGDKLVMGLASDRNATLDSVATNAWFMMAGANMNIYSETDDGTTDTDDKDTALDYVSGTYRWFGIDCTNLASIKFYLHDANNVWRPMQSVTHKMSAATGNVQPFFELTKASAANKDHSLLIDYIGLAWERE